MTISVHDGVQIRESTSFTANTHLLTHVDLPWTIPLRTWESYLPKLEQFVGTSCPVPSLRRVKDVLADWSVPRLFDAVIVDASAKISELLQAVASRAEVEQIPVDEPLSFEEMDPDQSMLVPDHDPFGSSMVQFTDREYLELLENLRLSEEELRPALESLVNRDDSSPGLLVIKTGWAVWRPRTQELRDLRHPIFQGWHPFLLHPFIDATLAPWLDKLAGVACDCPGLDCPIYDLSERLHPSYAIVKRKILSNKTSIKLPPGDEAKFLQALLLSKERVYLNNLFFPLEDIDQLWSSAKVASKGSLSWYRTRLLLTALPLGGESTDAIPVVVFSLQ